MLPTLQQVNDVKSAFLFSFWTLIYMFSFIFFCIIVILKSVITFGDLFEDRTSVTRYVTSRDMETFFFFLKKDSFEFKIIYARRGITVYEEQQTVKSEKGKNQNSGNSTD